jgi:tRNA dimethylallyltransferase
VLELGLNPPDLKTRIAARSATMFDNGLVQETRGLVERYGEDCPLLDTIGYSEARAELRGAISRAEAIAQTSRRTQQFAKRQRTWFRRQHQPLWLGPGGPLADGGSDPLQQALSAVERGLG